MKPDQFDRSTLAEITRSITEKSPPQGIPTKIIAIDGPGGAGKSTLATQLSRELGRAQIVQTDDFASWDNPIDWWPRVIAEVLVPIANDRPARFRRTDWEGKGREEWRTVTPAPYVILEGVSASREAFRPYLTYSIWVETPRHTRLRRGLERDGEAAREHWERWMAEEDAYVARENPRSEVDYIVRGGRRDWS
jgi:uridine kinase